MNVRFGVLNKHIIIKEMLNPHPSVKPLPIAQPSSNSVDSEKVFSYFEQQKSDIEKLSGKVEHDLEQLKASIMAKVRSDI